MTADLPIHPIVVHFPIALLVTGFLIDLAGAILKRSWLTHAGFLLLVIGALGAVVAARSGEAAEDQILQTPALRDTLEEHEEGGKRAMWVFLVLAALRSVLAWRGWFGSAVRWVFLVLWAAGLALLLEAAWHGGELVYRHGAGVAAVESHSD